MGHWGKSFNYRDKLDERSNSEQERISNLGSAGVRSTRTHKARIRNSTFERKLGTLPISSSVTVGHSSPILRNDLQVRLAFERISD